MSNDPSQQPTPIAPASSPDGSVPPVITDGGQPLSPDGGQASGAEVSAPATTAEGVPGKVKPKLPPTVSEKAVEAKVQQIRMQRLLKAENPTPEEDRARAIYELQMPWWQKAWMWTGLGEKNGWDWAQLLAVPIMLAIVTWGLSEYAKSRDQQQQQADKEKEQALADDKAKQDTLVKYLDDMAASLKDGLLKAKPGDDKFIVAQSRTVLALQSLDKRRQQLVIQFLQASGLNEVGKDKDTQKFLKELDEYSRENRSEAPQPSSKTKLGLLYGAQMEKANLTNSDLSGASLIGADLGGANLGCNPPDSKEPEHCSDLSKANLRNAYLDEVNLQGANLIGANIGIAALNNANLRGANLGAANLFDTNLVLTDLSGANLWGANLFDTNLEDANLSGANLIGANLREANLRKANLKEAIMLFTDLAGARYLTPEQLTGKDAPLLCNVRFPEYIKGVDPNRDCDRMPQELLMNQKRFSDLQSAKEFVNGLRQYKFKEISPRPLLPPPGSPILPLPVTPQ